MPNMEVIEIITSIDFVIFLMVGIGAGFLMGQITKNGLGATANIAIAIAGSVISGFIFDWLNFMNIGDIADPVIAGVVGAVLLLTIAALFRREKRTTHIE